MLEVGEFHTEDKESSFLLVPEKHRGRGDDAAKDEHRNLCLPTLKLIHGDFRETVKDRLVLLVLPVVMNEVEELAAYVELEDRQDKIDDGKNEPNLLRAIILSVEALREANEHPGSQHDNDEELRAAVRKFLDREFAY